MINYKIHNTYWIVYFKDYDKLIEASENYFSKKTIEYFKKSYKINLYFSYDDILDFSCSPITDIDFFKKYNYKFMGNFSLQTERKQKIKKINQL